MIPIGPTDPDNFDADLGPYVPEPRNDGLFFVILATAFSAGLVGFGMGLAFANHLAPWLRGTIG